MVASSLEVKRHISNTVKTLNIKARILWTLLPDGSYYPFALRERIWELKLLIGLWDELEGIYESDLLMAIKAGELTYQAKVLMKQGELLCRRQDFINGEKRIRQAMDVGRKTDDVGLVERIEDQLAGVYMFTKRYDEAEEIYDRLLATTEKRGNEPTAGWFLNHKATIALEKGRIGDAVKYIRRRLNIARKHGSLRDLAHGYLTLGGIYGELGKYSTALRYNRLSAEISKRISDIFLYYYAIYNMGMASEKLGQKAEALRYLHQDLEMARQLGDVPGAQTILEDIDRMAGEDR